MNLQRRPAYRQWIVCAAATAALLWGSHCGLQADDARPFSIRVVDETTGRGVPLVELRTTGNLVYITDSAGYVAFDEPGLMETRVFFSVQSHGYEFPKDGFGFAGKGVDVVPGGSATLTIRRTNIAERMYRVTGQGIYADSVRLGLDTPLDRPVINSLVTGQDSVQAVVHRGGIRWFWGDTNRVAYPLGQFGTSAATSELPAHGGLDPALGVNLVYLADDKGFSRPVFKLDRPGPVWVDGVLSVKDAAGEERLVCHYSRMKDLGTRVEHGLAVFNESTQAFEIVKELPAEEFRHPAGHATEVADGDGTRSLYFSNPYPMVRVPAEYEAVLDPERYTAFTPLTKGSRFDSRQPSLDRDSKGRIRYDWKPETPAVDAAQHLELVKSGALAAEDAWFRTVDAATGKAIVLHGGTVRWNEYRQRWVMIAVQIYGESSVLGEVWYAEALRPEGPFASAVRIATHDRYSFYNPAHHAFFDQEGGRLIHFEGTYTYTFSGNPVPTPRYDYNQILYRLDLSDPRLEPAHVDERTQ